MKQIVDGYRYCLEQRVRHQLSKHCEVRARLIKYRSVVSLLNEKIKLRVKCKKKKKYRNVWKKLFVKKLRY